jgi:hypothetical protein
MTASKSACSLSMRFTKTARAIPISPAISHSRSVWTCGPDTASTTNSAISAASMPAIASPTKSE